MRAFITRYPVLTFMVLTLALQYITIAVAQYIAGPGQEMDSTPLSHMVLRSRVFGPLFVCLWVTWYLESWQGIRKLLGTYLYWRTPIKWYAVAIGWKFVLGWIGMGLAVLCTDAIWPGWFDPGFWPGYRDALLFLLIVTFIEETAWIRFCVSRMQEKYSALYTAFMVGNGWVLWYLPLFIMGVGVPTGYPVIIFYLAIVSLCVLLVWIYNSSRSGVVLLLTQISSNSAFFMVSVLPGSIMRADGTADNRYVIWYGVVFALFAAGLAVVLGPKNLSRKPRAKWSDSYGEPADAARMHAGGH